MPPLECRKLSSEWKRQLLEFFCDIQEAGYVKYFHPHPFTAKEIEKLIQYDGKDLYYILVEGERILGYAMLRGWDEGYEIPSLGIVIHPSIAGTGMGRVFMHFLHATAKRQGATKIRLKVYPDNIRALKMYKTLNYKFQPEEGGQLLGIVKL